MSTITYYVAISFVLDHTGSVVAGDAFECPNVGAAIMIAEAVTKTGGVVGSLAFSRTGDPDTVAFEDAVVLKTFGQVPSDLATLI
jgi:hypothetical protein